MKRAASLLCLLLLAGATGCSDEPSAAAPAPETAAPAPAPSDEPAPAEQVGTLSLALKLPGATFESFSYTIVGPGYSKASTIDVSQSTTVSALIDGIPAGTDYSITLLGSTTVPSDANCTGSAAFAITAGEVSEVPVAINCHVQDEATPPVVAASVPVPQLASFALGMLLLAAGSRARRRRA